MADNYIENQYEKYAARKAAWERERKLGKRRRSGSLHRSAKQGIRSVASSQSKKQCMQATDEKAE